MGLGMSGCIPCSRIRNRVRKPHLSTVMTAGVKSGRYIFRCGVCASYVGYACCVCLMAVQLLPLACPTMTLRSFQVICCRRVFAVVVDEYYGKRCCRMPEGPSCCLDFSSCCSCQYPTSAAVFGRIFTASAVYVVCIAAGICIAAATTIFSTGTYDSAYCSVRETCAE